ncbi:MAG: diguanylate cyclase, partial [Burkholderiales bacterium]
ERVRAAVAARDWGDIAPGLALSVSVGLAGYRKDDTAEQLIKRADAALYAAKDRGRNQIVSTD